MENCWNVNAALKKNHTFLGSHCDTFGIVYLGFCIVQPSSERKMAATQQMAATYCTVRKYKHQETENMHLNVTQMIKHWNVTHYFVLKTVMIVWFDGLLM